MRGKFDIETFNPERFALRDVPEEKITKIIEFFELARHNLHRMRGGFLTASNIRINPGSVVADITYGVKGGDQRWAGNERGNTYLKELFTRFLSAEQRKKQREISGTTEDRKVGVSISLEP